MTPAQSALGNIYKFNINCLKLNNRLRYSLSLGTAIVLYGVVISWDD